MRIVYLAALATLGCMMMHSCNYDYTPSGDLWKNYKPKVVVNSIINPDSAIMVKLFWSQRSDTHVKNFDTVQLAHVEIREDDAVIIDTDVVGGALSTEFFPQSDTHYSIRVTVPEYGALTAQTYIPKQPSIDAEFIKVVGNNANYVHFRINSVELPQASEAMWIVGGSIADDGQVSTISSFYTNTPYPDQFNLVMDSEDVTLKGSNVGFEEFMRVESGNLKYMFPLSFSAYLFTVQFWVESPSDGESIQHKDSVENIYLTAISPSLDYDNYHRSAYRQKRNIDLPQLDDTKRVYCNINNGLGIFAGYNSASFIRDYKSK